MQWPLGMLAVATISEEVAGAAEALKNFKKHISRKYKSVLRAIETAGRLFNIVLLTCRSMYITIKGRWPLAE